MDISDYCKILICYCLLSTEHFVEAAVGDADTAQKNGELLQSDAVLQTFLHEIGAVIRGFSTFTGPGRAADVRRHPLPTSALQSSWGQRAPHHSTTFSFFQPPPPTRRPQLGPTTRGFPQQPLETPASFKVDVPEALGNLANYIYAVVQKIPAVTTASPSTITTPAPTTTTTQIITDETSEHVTSSTTITNQPDVSKSRTSQAPQETVSPSDLALYQRLNNLNNYKSNEPLSIEMLNALTPHQRLILQHIPQIRRDQPQRDQPENDDSLARQIRNMQVLRELQQRHDEKVQKNERKAQEDIATVSEELGKIFTLLTSGAAAAPGSTTAVRRRQSFGDGANEVGNLLRSLTSVAETLAAGTNDGGGGGGGGSGGGWSPTSKRQQSEQPGDANWYQLTSPPTTTRTQSVPSGRSLASPRRHHHQQHLPNNPLSLLMKIVEPLQYSTVNAQSKQVLGTGPRETQALDFGGPNLDRIVVHKVDGQDVLGNPVVGGWHSTGLQWTNGDLRLVNVNGDTLLGSNVGVRDQSVDIPISKLLHLTNTLVPLPAQTRQDPRGYLVRRRR